MDDKLLLEAIGQMMDQKLAIERDSMSQMMDQKLEPINERLDKMEVGQASLQADVASLQADVASLQDDISFVRGTVTVLEHDHGQKLNAIWNGLQGFEESSKRIRRLEDKAEDHGDRIFALEQVVGAG